uniref:JmjC domain-containing protein n=1 Tax=Bionectria ochroleuca TaxID=29856 RepID=A0A8H7TVK3_BIOOC
MMSLEECNLYSVHLPYEGRRVWICVSSGARKKFEARVRKDIARTPGEDAKTSHCGQFVRHARLYFSRSLLEKWGIEYTIVDQKAGDVVVTFPGTYHQGFTLGSGTPRPRQ